MISLFALLFAAAPAPTPIDFVVGHCFVGKPKPTQTDRHCFRRGADGAIRDHHDVTEGGKVLMSGDTIYRWVGASLHYTYRDSRGGVLSSAVTRSGNAIDFGTAAYRTKDGTTYTIHARWTVLSATSY